VYDTVLQAHESHCSFQSERYVSFASRLGLKAVHTSHLRQFPKVKIKDFCSRLTANGHVRVLRLRSSENSGDPTRVDVQILKLSH
jgi:hypothetical protein